MPSDKFLSQIISKEAVGIELFQAAAFYDTCKAIATFQENNFDGHIHSTSLVLFLDSSQIINILSTIVSTSYFKISFIGNYDDGNNVFKPVYLKYKSQSANITDFVFVDASTGQEIDYSIYLCGLLTVLYDKASE